MSNQKSQTELNARPISHWQYATLMDVRSGRARRRAREQNTTTLRLLNAQTLSSLLYRGYLDCDGAEEPWVTEIGEEVIRLMGGGGRYRRRAGEITWSVRNRITSRRKRAGRPPRNGRLAA